MGKQTLNRAKKILSILLLILFAISVTAATVSADYYSTSHCKGGHWECSSPYYGYNYGCNGHLVCPGSSGGSSYGGDSSGGGNYDGGSYGGSSGSY